MTLSWFPLSLCELFNLAWQRGLVLISQTHMIIIYVTNTVSSLIWRRMKSRNAAESGKQLFLWHIRRQSVQILKMCLTISRDKILTITWQMWCILPTDDNSSSFQLLKLSSSRYGYSVLMGINEANCWLVTSRPTSVNHCTFRTDHQGKSVEGIYCKYGQMCTWQWINDGIFWGVSYPFKAHSHHRHWLQNFSCVRFRTQEFSCKVTILLGFY